MSRDIAKLHQILEVRRPPVAPEELPEMAVRSGPLNELNDVRILNSLCDEDDRVRDFLVRNFFVTCT